MSDDMNGCTNCDDYVPNPGLCAACRRIHNEGIAEGRKLAMKEIAVNARFIAANQAANRSQAAQVYADALDDFADTIEQNIERADHVAAEAEEVKNG